MNIFYRVSNINTKQGLWYDQQGNFTGLIHNKLSFCLHNNLRMDYDPEIVGWLSATPSLDTLYEWFPRVDIVRLQRDGFFIHKYYAEDYKWYERFKHYIIKQDTSVVVDRIVLK